MPDTLFELSRYENRNGSTSWRVTGCLHGIRIRKNFKKREEAAAEMATLEIKAIQASSGLRHHSYPPVRRTQQLEAEHCFGLWTVSPARFPSTLILRCLSNYREPEHQKPLAAAISDYTQAKAYEFEQGHISKTKLSRIIADLKCLAAHFPKNAVAELSLPSLIEFFELGHPSMKTYTTDEASSQPFTNTAFSGGRSRKNDLNWNIKAIGEVDRSGGH